jgi:hypothetical protein
VFYAGTPTVPTPVDDAKETMTSGPWTHHRTGWQWLRPRMRFPNRRQQ